MFQRRVISLLVLGVAVVLAVTAQSLRLSRGAMHDRLADEADRALQRTTYLPTQRGEVLDRHGRVLAYDDPAYDVAVSYDVIAGAWPASRARRAAYYQYRELWTDLEEAQRERLAEGFLPKYEAQVEALWARIARVMAGPGADAAAITAARARLRERLDDIRAGVLQDASYLWDRWRARRERELNEPVPLTDVMQPIREQRMAHAVALDIPREAALDLIERIEAAEADDDVPRFAPASDLADDGGRDGGSAADDGVGLGLDIWREVEIERPTRRRYPSAQMTYRLDRATLPGYKPPDDAEGDSDAATPGRVVEVRTRGVGLHVLGWMRPAWREDVEAKPFLTRDDRGRAVVDLGGYRDGDRVGAAGVERSAEALLHGRRGQRVRHLGTGDEQVVPAMKGRPLHLTLDVRLQGRVQALMDDAFGVMVVQPKWHPEQPVEEYPHAPRPGESLNGAAVVLDVDSGEVLAMVSKPALTRTGLFGDRRALLDDQLNTPMINRAAQRAFQPGSVIKPLVYSSCVKFGVSGIDEPIFCQGYLDDGHPDRYRCWVFKRYLTGHGLLDPVQGIAQSCNLYFYTLGDRIGVPRLAEGLSWFGLGRPTEVGLPEAIDGELPAVGDADGSGDREYHRADGIFMAIGQGPVRWTPLQAANAYATLARGGVYLPATVIADTDRAALGWPAREATDLGLPAKAAKNALDGLFEVVNGERGTGRLLAKLREPIFPPQQHPELSILGKSGTAQAVPLRRSYDDNGDGYPDRWGEVLRDGDHAWFLALLQPDGAPRPKYVVAVVCEFGGSGSNVAGPVANQIIHALRAEGYLAPAG